MTVLKRPRAGDLVETGRYGVCLVDRVHGNGTVLTVTDRLGRVEQVERADRGWWRTERAPRTGPVPRTRADGSPWWRVPAGG